MRSAVLIVLLAAVAHGCALAPAYRPPAVGFPAAFRETSDSPRSGARPQAADADRPAAAGARPSLDYWRLLGDTTLSQLITEMLEANPDVHAARARLAAARSDRTRAALEFTPSTGVFGAFTRQRIATPSVPGAAGEFPDQSLWEAGFDASWELDVFGRIRHEVRSRSALVGAAEHDLRDVQVTLSAELARAYFELRGAQEQLEVASRNAENQRRTLDVTRQRLDAGRGTALDTERAQSQLSSTLASIPVRETQVSVALNRIAVMVGRHPAQVAASLVAVAPMPSVPEVTAIGEPELVVRDRPDVAAAERRAASLHALAASIRAGYLPRLTVAGTVGGVAGEPDEFGDDGTLRYAVGPVVTWPAFDLGRVKAEADAVDARSEGAHAEYDRAVLAAVEDIETSLSLYRGARARVESLDQASAASERAADLARLRFREGTIDFLQVLDAERTQLEAQDQAVEGRIAAAIAYAALYKALGGR